MITKFPRDNCISLKEFLQTHHLSRFAAGRRSDDRLDVFANTEHTKRFYRRKYDAKKVLATFIARLRKDVDIEKLSLDLRVGTAPSLASGSQRGRLCFLGDQ